MKDYHYVYGVNDGALMHIRLFKNRGAYKVSLGLAKKKHKLLTVYAGKILDGKIVWDKPTLPK